MPNSAVVIDFASALKELNTVVEKQERAYMRAAVSDAFEGREAAMASWRLAAATQKFYTIIVPHFEHRFWGTMTAAEQDAPNAATNIADADITSAADRWPNLGQPLGTNEKQRVRVIFSEIKRMILDQIIVDPAADQVIRNWIDIHKEMLIDCEHEKHEEAMRASREAEVRLSNGSTIRGYLTSRTSLEQSAWRNFDPNAPIADWNNYFVGQLGTIGRRRVRDKRPVAEVQRRLAYYYLVATDNTLDPEISSLIRGNFIGQLADIRRAHNKGASAAGIDNPSCSPGTVGRIAKMGDNHPVAALALEPLPLILQAFSSITQSALAQAFGACATLQDKIDLRDALRNLHAGNIDDILNHAEEYSEHLLEIRQRFINGLGSEAELMTQMNTVLHGQQLPALSEAYQAKVRLMRMDPALTQGVHINTFFKKSLTAADKECLAVLEPTLTQNFDLLMDAARAEAQENASAEASDFSEVEAMMRQEAAIRQKVIQTLAAKRKWGTEATVNAEISHYEEQRLVTRYRTIYERHNAFLQRQHQRLIAGAKPEQQALLAANLSPENLHQFTLKAMIPNAGFMEPQVLAPLKQVLSEQLTTVQDAKSVRDSATSAAVLADIATRPHTNTALLRTITAHRHASVVVLQSVARNANTDLANLWAIARHRYADAATIAAVATNRNADAALLGGIARHLNADALILKAIACHRHADAAALEYVARHRRADAAVLAAITFNYHINTATLEHVARNVNANAAVLWTVAAHKHADAITLQAVARNANTNTAVLKKVAQHANADVTALQAVTRNNNTNADVLAAVVRNANADPIILEAIAYSSKSHAAILATIFVHRHADANVLGAIACNRHTDAALLVAIARHPEADSEVLRTVARHRHANAIALETVAQSKKATAPALTAVAHHLNANAAILATLATHTSANAATLAAIARNPNVNAATDVAALAAGTAYHQPIVTQFRRRQTL